jgi:hypothetical protein
MKTKLLLVLLIALPVLMQGQEWAPIGAEWHYDITYAFSGDIDYQRVYCNSIVNVKGIDCKEINIDYCACNNHFCKKLYTYQADDTIFFYNPDVDTFQILYNFNASPNDTWTITYKDLDERFDTVTIQVDSVLPITINSRVLKKQYVTYYYDYKTDTDKGFGERSVIIETLGDMNFLINIHDMYYSLCDDDNINGLRCYKDPQFGFYSSDLRTSCDYTYKWTSTQDLSISYLEPFPNPVLDYLKISIDDKSDIFYELFEVDGQLIKSGNDNIVDMREYLPGLYFIKIYENNKTMKTYKILKH